MSALSEYENMLRSFRCQDLANLLAFANQSKNGKKQELLERSVQLLKKGGITVQMKVSSIHMKYESVNTDLELKFLSHLFYTPYKRFPMTISLGSVFGMVGEF